MLELQGTHGTTKTRAQKIIETKRPKSSQVGHLGSGFYLWRYDKFAYHLAVGWWKKQCESGAYKKDPDSGCSVLFVTLSVSKDEVIDFEDDEFRDMLARFLVDRGDFIKDEISRSRFYDEFIYVLEQQQDVNVTVVRGKTNAPKGKYCNYPRFVFGKPTVFVVKNFEPVKEISIWGDNYDE